MNSNDCHEKTEVEEKNREQFFLQYGINRFPERLKEAMARAHIPSNNQLAKLTELSEATIRKYLKGETYPTLDRLALLADACSCSLAWLASGEGKGDMDTIKTNEGFGKINEKKDSEFENILSYLTDEQREKLLKVIYTQGIATILRLDDSLGTQLLALPDEEKERLLTLHEAKKGASDAGDRGESGSPTQQRAG
jgi:transcriptional regulator with XRE-family HTH domain